MLFFLKAKSCGAVIWCYKKCISRWAVKKEKNTKLYPVLGSVCVCSPRAATTCRSKSNSPGRRTCCCAAVGLLGLMLEGQPAGRGPESLCVCWEGKRARRKKNWGGWSKPRMTRVHKFRVKNQCWLFRYAERLQRYANAGGFSIRLRCSEQSNHHKTGRDTRIRGLSYGHVEVGSWTDIYGYLTLKKN